MIIGIYLGRSSYCFDLKLYCLTIFAGTPTATENGGIDLVTAELAPITECLPWLLLPEYDFQAQFWNIIRAIDCDFHMTK